MSKIKTTVEFTILLLASGTFAYSVAVLAEALYRTFG